MSRRARALGFAAAAAVCAGLAAAATGSAPGGFEARYGALQEVVVVTESLPAGRRLGRAAIGERLEIRRVPERFVPPDALNTPAQALGHRPVTAVAAGGYLLASQFETPSGGAERSRPPLAAGLRPVEITVQGAGALAAAGGGHRRVDVVVTTESTPGGGSGRTFVAAPAVGLLELRQAGAAAGGDPLAPSPSETWTATLALSRRQALRLIHAQSFARDVRLIGR